MPNTLELRAGPHRATVKVGDVVPMTDGTRWYVFERAGSGIGEHLSLHKPGTGPGTTSYYLNGHPCLGSGLPSIDIAALATQQPPAVTLAAAQVMAEAILKEMGPVVGTPEWLARHGDKMERRQREAAEKWASVALAALRAAGLLEDAP
jgi:hypothetical protein